MTDCLYYLRKGCCRDCRHYPDDLSKGICAAGIPVCPILTDDAESLKKCLTCRHFKEA